MQTALRCKTVLFLETIPITESTLMIDALFAIKQMALFAES